MAKPVKTSAKTRSGRQRPRDDDGPYTVVEVRFLLKVAGTIDPDDADALDHIDDNVTAMIDERCMQHRQNPPDPPESEPTFVDAAGFRVLWHGKDFG